MTKLPPTAAALDCSRSRREQKAPRFTVVDVAESPLPSAPVISDADLLDRVRRFALLSPMTDDFESERLRGFNAGDAACRKRLREILGIEE